LRFDAALLFRYRWRAARPFAAAAYPGFPAYLFAEPVVAQGLALGQGEADVIDRFVVELVPEQGAVVGLPGCVVFAQFEVEGVWLMKLIGLRPQWFWEPQPLGNVINKFDLIQI
jgi:hypothetical protein